MLTWSAWLLTGGVLLGLILVALSQAARPTAQPWWPGALHGVLGAAGLGLLVLGLGGPRHGVEQGAGSFGLVAAWLVAAALGLGSLLALARMRRRPPSMLVVGVHATLGVGGLVLLATYLSV